jgi:hypothetical protein
MPNYRALAARFAQQAGIDPGVFTAQISQESGFNPTARSGAGAVGIAQIVPRWHPGVDATDPVASLQWAARDIAQGVKKYGSYERALSAYNSGRPDKYLDPKFAGGQTYNYVRSIMSAAKRGGGRTLASAGVPATGAPLNAVPTGGAPSLGGDPIAAALIGSLGQSPEAVNQALLGASLSSPPPTQAAVRPSLPMTVAAPLTPSAAAGRVTLSKGADRPGVSTNPAVLDFVGQIAGLANTPLQIGTGTNHNQYVAGTNRESAHWVGNAADVPASGAQLTRLGQDALIAAGMPPAQARQQQGGLFNVGGYQVIFNSMEGGNHFNHLHVGLRGEHHG